MVTCGDLGIEPEVLDKRLQDIFVRASDWNTIVLLDEADVFFSERDIHDLQRNALVSILLRHLEYSDCLLFLATSRAGQADEAVGSRMQLTLGLPDFNSEGQHVVWHNLLQSLQLESSQRVALDHFVAKELEELLLLENEPAYSMNGRQIRNCLRAALALAQREESPLDKDHIKRTIDLGKDFRRYMVKVNRASQENRMRHLGLRY
jgi:hypothetical protein